MSCGGAPARADHFKSLSELGFNIIGGYGMTEASPTVTLHNNGRKKPLSAGKAFPRAQFKIDNPDEEGIGEILLKGDNITKGYYKDPEATAASFTEDGWFSQATTAELTKTASFTSQAVRSSSSFFPTAKTSSPRQ